MHRLVIRAVVLFLCAPVLAPTESFAQWWPTIHTDTELGDVGPLRVGLSAGAVVPTGTAFYDVDDAASVQLLIAMPIEPFDEFRVGAGYSSHFDNINGDDVGVTMIFVEPLFGFGHGSQRLRLGPRAIYVHQARDLFLHRMHGFGFGAMASLAQQLGPRVAIEISASMTGTMLPRTDWRDGSIKDLANWSNAWFRELRIGVTGRPW